MLKVWGMYVSCLFAHHSFGFYYRFNLSTGIGIPVGNGIYEGAREFVSLQIAAILVKLGDGSRRDGTISLSDFCFFCEGIDLV